MYRLSPPDNMDHFIEQIEIKNFKSIRELSLTGFKRINLFIGRPNVGKSNLLEALSLFSLPYVEISALKMSDVVRTEVGIDLFYDGLFLNEGIYVMAGTKDGHTLDCNCSFLVDESSLELDFEYTHQVLEKGEVYIKESDSYRLLVMSDFNILKNELQSPIYESIKYYLFNRNIVGKIYAWKFLQPPFGNNILRVLELNHDLRKIYANWLKQYNMRLVLDRTTQSLKIQKDKGDEVFQLPYSSVADTLQRIIFYKTAIASNENSVLLFEEPEAHAYPPYISEFTQEVIGSKTNQTFIVTHSPLIVNDMLDNAIDDLAIFIVDFKDGQTVSRPLTQEELHEVRKFGVDLFFNGEAYPV